MNLGDYMALVGLVISALMYISFIRDEKGRPLTVAEYFHSGRQGSAKQFGPSFAAASTSLATVLMFFIAATSTYGVFLFWCGISYFMGQFLFLYLMKRGGIETKNLTTNAHYWFDRTQGLMSANSIRAMTVFSFLIILFLEIYIGSEIINYYIGSETGVPKIAGFAFIALVVVIYVRFGGMNVVLKSDRWQFILMVCACGLFFLFALAFKSPNGPSSITFLDGLTNIEITPWHLIIFLAWIGLQNITLPFTQLSSWQRLASMKTVDTAMDGLRNVWVGFFILWLIPVMALLVLSAKGAMITDISSLFDTLKSMDNMISATIFAIIFVGFSSALFSTADTALIALELAISEKIPNYMQSGKLNKTHLNIIVFVIVTLLVGAYFIVESDIVGNFMNVIFILFSQLAIIAPHMLYALFTHASGKPQINLTKTGDFVLSLGIWVAWAVLVSVSLIPETFYVEPAFAPMVGSFIGLAVSTITLFIGVKFGTGTVIEDMPVPEVR